jgi:hypothetical protein
LFGFVPRCTFRTHCQQTTPLFSIMGPTSFPPPMINHTSSISPLSLSPPPAQLGLAPLVFGGLLKPQSSPSIFGLSGYSGAGAVTDGGGVGGGGGEGAVVVVVKVVMDRYLILVKGVDGICSSRRVRSSRRGGKEKGAVAIATAFVDSTFCRHRHCYCRLVISRSLLSTTTPMSPLITTIRPSALPPPHNHI